MITALILLGALLYIFIGLIVLIHFCRKDLIGLTGLAVFWPLTLFAMYVLYPLFNLFYNLAEWTYDKFAGVPENKKRVETTSEKIMRLSKEMEEFCEEQIERQEKKNNG